MWPFILRLDAKFPMFIVVAPLGIVPDVLVATVAPFAVPAKSFCLYAKPLLNGVFADTVTEEIVMFCWGEPPTFVRYVGAAALR